MINKFYYTGLTTLLLLACFTVTMGMWHGISEITNYLMQILFVTLCIFIYLTILFYSIEFFIKRFKTKPKTKYYSEKVSKQHEFNNFKNIKIN